MPTITVNGLSNLPGGFVHTTRLVNKISDRAYEACGDEFEFKLVYERLAYTGGENPLTLTSRNFTVGPHRIDNIPGGSKRLTYPPKLNPPAQEGTIQQAAVVYELNSTDFYTRQWLELRAIVRLLESKSLQFRIEAFNGYNHASFINLTGNS